MPTETAQHAAPAALITDVLIIGGGFVGGTLSCALEHFGFSSVVIEAGQPQRALLPEFDGRATAISLTSRRLLQSVGLWDKLAAHAAPMLDIRVSDADSPLYLHYDHHDVGDEPFGHMLENRFMRAALFERMDELAAIRLLAPARIDRLERNTSGVEGYLTDGRCVRARLVVAAEGRHSPTREAAGIRTTGWSYGQTAIVCTVAHERPHHSVAHEHFLPAGPFAILPLNGNRASIVWTELESIAPSIMALNDADFLSELRRRFGDFLGRLEIVGPRFSYPLALQYAERPVDTRLALVGDAVHAMHPIAGQGLNMGLRDVAALADTLADARLKGEDLGSPQVLARYARARRFDNMVMLAATDGLNRLFSNRLTPLRLARDLGLAAVNRMPALKRVFMRHAMGDMGEIPSLMR